MAYSDKQKTKMYNDALKGIEELNLFFIEDIIALMPVCKQTFYEFWPIDSNELDTIKELLEQNKVNEKIALRKLFKEGASSEKLALYKLICTDTERKSLSMNHIDHTSDGEKLQSTIIVTNQRAKDNLELLENED
jgi:hypothetical protein